LDAANRQRWSKREAHPNGAAPQCPVSPRQHSKPPSAVTADQRQPAQHQSAQAVRPCGNGGLAFAEEALALGKRVPASQRLGRGAASRAHLEPEQHASQRAPRGSETRPARKIAAQVREIGRGLPVREACSLSGEFGQSRAPL
jgi:hypothetical protein